MITLAIDTTKKESEVALSVKDNIFYNDNGLKNKGHSETLLQNINEVLEKGNVTLKEVKNILVITGPGSFTGIRIGISTVKGFMAVLDNINLMSASGFDVLAHNVDEKYKKDKFSVGINANNKGAYVAGYSAKDKKIKNIKWMDMATLKECVANSGMPFFVSEYELDYFIGAEVDALGVVLRKESILEVAESKVKSKGFCKEGELNPLYIKLSQAENAYIEKVAKAIVFEKVNEKNAQEIFEIEEKSFEKSWSLKTIKEELLLEDRTYFLAKLNEENVGYISVWKTGEDYNILKVAVLPSKRRLKIGTLLIEKVINFVKEVKGEKLFLEVSEENEPAINLYSKCGFIKEHTRKKYYPNGKDALVMFYNKK